MDWGTTDRNIPAGAFANLKLSLEQTLIAVTMLAVGLSKPL
jgi:hypothetical protein